MEYMPEFKLLAPATVDEAVAMQRSHPQARLLGGGTDLTVNIRRGIAAPPALIDVNGIDEMRKIEADGDGGLIVGAAVTLAELAADARVAADYAGIAEAAAEVAAPSHREVATVGGNLCLDTRCVFYNQSEWWRRANDYCLKYCGDVCHVAPSGDHCFAAFSGDLAPAMMVLDAAVDIASPDGARTLALADMYDDDGAAHLLLAPDEILTWIRLPGATRWRTGYAKSRIRGAIDFPLVGAAIALMRTGDALAAIRVALTGTNSKPLLIEGTDVLLGQPFDAAAGDRLAGLLAKQIQPMTSTFVRPGYRRRVIANLTRALAHRLFDSG